LKGRLKSRLYSSFLKGRGEIKEGEGIIFIGSNAAKLYKQLKIIINAGLGAR